MKLKFGTVLVFALSVMLVGVSLSEQRINKENDEQPIPVSNEEFEKSDEIDASKQQFVDTEVRNTTM